MVGSKARLFTGSFQTFSGPKKFVWGEGTGRCTQYLHVELLGHMLVWPSGGGRPVDFLVHCDGTCGVPLGRSWA